jgi:LAS superfamily LD-carboxypeptidase LdcB
MWAHQRAVSAFTALSGRAATAGFDMRVASAFRSYDRQLDIVNAKWLGHRPVLNDEGVDLHRAAVSDADWLAAILRFSALPGTSRHHWGTDFDIWDRSTVTDDYAPQLLASEYQSDGVFAEMNAWLDDQISADNAEGFYKPYDVDRGGVAPEPWHISYRPVAEGYHRQLSLSDCLPLWHGQADPAGQCHAPLQMVSVLEADAEVIFKRYVLLT